MFIAPLSLVLLALTTTHAQTSYPTIPTTGTIFGKPPYLSVSYYYPIEPSASQKQTYSTGVWPPTLPIRPSGIYECLPPPDLGMEMRTYTCKNKLLCQDQRTPEAIRAHEEARARDWDGAANGVCDANTGLAITTLHWGVWQHNCWSEKETMREHRIPPLSIHSDPKEGLLHTNVTRPFKQALSDVAKEHISWNRRALYWRRYTLLQLAAHNHKLNCQIRDLWAVKNFEMQQYEKIKESWRFSDKRKYREMLKREAKFWVDSFRIREKGRELEKLVPVYFTRRMEGDPENKYYGWLGLGDVQVEAGEAVEGFRTEGSPSR